MKRVAAAVCFVVLFPNLIAMAADRPVNFAGKWIPKSKVTAHHPVLRAQQLSIPGLDDQGRPQAASDLDIRPNETDEEHTYAALDRGPRASEIPLPLREVIKNYFLEIVVTNDELQMTSPAMLGGPTRIDTLKYRLDEAKHVEHFTNKFKRTTQLKLRKNKIEIQQVIESLETSLDMVIIEVYALSKDGKILTYTTSFTSRYPGMTEELRVDQNRIVYDRQ
jgi:hypothetical protein